MEIFQNFHWKLEKKKTFNTGIAEIVVIWILIFWRYTYYKSVYFSVYHNIVCVSVLIKVHKYTNYFSGQLVNTWRQIVLSEMKTRIADAR